jgi:gliding motility-associated-like protein
VYNCDYYIPNVFSPNKDGQNDFFTVFGNDAIADIISLNILDRWGNLLWEGKHLKTSGEKGWDGKLNGQECLPGAYVYTCEILWLDNHREKAAGTITLVK